MTNIRARGFDNTAQLQEHLAGLEDEPTEDDAGIQTAQGDYHDELAAIREEISELRRQLAAIRAHRDRNPEPTTADRPWLRIAVTVGTTFVLGRLVQNLRLGAPGAAAVSLIATQLAKGF
ncbi:hypothetical protein [Rhizobium sp. RM]|uniref:hypothetical protein n=1 Tax=Rhizobium sp. RM TaxID=2748079 RepID=UPI00110E1F96|nr:hypothetical protein [Rhizobium sp. RM]NWJ27606.1 hypothetical protein [Rhizobium sp. RM]TMV19944.1 hypothetical protein BJG94_11080 [Rhizobium sp. Td3]